MPFSILLLALLTRFESAVSNSAHDFHVSRLTVNVDTQDQRIELTLDTFIDDLEEALGASPLAREAGISAESLDLASPSEHAMTDSLLVAYLTRTLQLSLDDKPLALSYRGKEAAEDPYAVYIYLTATLPTLGESDAFALESKYLTELHDDQQNIVVWQRDGTSGDFDLLTRSSRIASFER